MAIKNNGAIRKQLRILFNLGTIGTLTDGQLLERFASGHGETRELAFAALVERHGPFVLHICRAILGNEHEADDAFQATFFALVRKAKYLWVQDSLGPWLHQAAYRAASHDRAARTRRRVHEHTAALKSERLEHSNQRDGLEAVIHEEVNRLPARYRVAVVLCDLEGRTHEQAARHMGCAVGTVKSRLARGRQKLRGRLVQRGVAPETCAVAAGAGRLAVPPALVEATVRYAMAGKAPGGLVPAALALLSLYGEWRQLVITASLTVALTLTLAALGAFPDDSKSNAVAGVKLTFVDLQWIGNQKLSEKIGDLDGNDLAAVPKGPQKLAGTWFKVGEQLVRVRGQQSPVATREVPGLLRLEALKSGATPLRSLSGQVGSTVRPVLTPARQSNGTNTMMALMSMRGMTQSSPEPPEAVRGIVIGARFDTLHILHTTMFGNAFGAEDGTEIGTYIVHYADRTVERIPIIYGKDVRDWWRSSDPAETSQARLAWGGKNAAVSETDQIRLFSSEWKNPHPDTRVMSIDFETKGTACSPFLVALTLERAVYYEARTASP